MPEDTNADFHLSETEIKSRFLSTCVHHYTLRAPCPEGQGTILAMKYRPAVYERTLNALDFISSHNFKHVRAMPSGFQGSGALGDASTPGTPAGSIAASAHGGTYSHIAVAGGA